MTPEEYAREMGDYFEPLWNERLADRFPRIASITMTKRRCPKLKERLVERGVKIGDVEGGKAVIDELIGKIENVPFLCGEVKPWAISIDWVLGPENFDKTMERLNEREATGPAGDGRSNFDSATRAEELLGTRRRAAGGRR